MPTPKTTRSAQQEEQNIYDLIVRRFLSHYYPPAVYNNHEVLTQVLDEMFRTRAKEQLDLGWRVVLSGDDGSRPERKDARQEEVR